MSTSLTVRDIDPADKSWLRREARHVGVSMEEFVRRLIHEKRTRTERRPKPSEAFAAISENSTASRCRPRRVLATGHWRSPKRTASDCPPCLADRHAQREFL